MLMWPPLPIIAESCWPEPLDVEVNWTNVREQFPALNNCTFLNTATFGQLPRSATEAVARHFAHRDELACGDFLQWFDDMDRVRAKVAKLIACHADDIAFVANASTGLAILLNGIDWKPGDEVITLRGEFPNNPYAASALERFGVKVVEAENWDHFCFALSPRTKLAVLSTVNYATGFRPPLKEASGMLHERGILLYLDGTQSIGALRFDATAIQPDFLAVDGYKWLLCANGAAFIYVPAEVRKWLRPNVIGWRSDRGWRNVNQLNHGVPELPESAERYEGGMIPFALLYAMEASLDLMLALGVDSIEKRVLDLAEKTAQVLRSYGAQVEDYASPIVAARFTNRDASQLAVSLKEQRILVAARHGFLRVSPHLYNNESDLNRLEEVLRRS